MKLDMNSVQKRRWWAPAFLAMLLLSATSWAAKDSITSLLKDKNAITSNEGDFLKPDEAFKFHASMTEPDAIRLNFVIADGYYLYRDQFFRVTTDDSALVQLGTPQFPEGEEKEDEFNGKQIVFHNLLDVTVPVGRAADAKGKFTIKVRYQGCAEKGLCYVPITKTVSLTLPATDVATSAAGKPSASGGDMVSEQDGLASLIRDGNLFLVLATFFGLGALLSLTPCVLPMIPIISGIIVGQGSNMTAKRGFALAFTYVQGMALTYAAAGAIFVLAFQQAPQAFFQHPAFIISFSVLFIVLAFAMFGSFTLQMPSSIQSRLTDVSNAQKSGTYIGTFVMGALSALIVTACVAPAMIAALTVISQTHMLARGSAALYFMGLGMGLPVLIVGASAGTLLPKAGAWMDTVKSIFGVMFLGLSVFFISNLQMVPAPVTMALWAMLSIVSGFWLFALQHGEKRAPSVVRGFGLLILVYGIALLLGALSGRTDPLQPLAGLSASAGSTPAASVSVEQHSLPFKRIKTVVALDEEIATAKAANKTVMFDFYADWCTSCKEMEKYTFTDARVAKALENTVWLQADVTENNADDQALLNRFGIFGPPSIMFFGTDGVERKNYRVVGYMKADKFHSHVTDAFAG